MKNSKTTAYTKHIRKLRFNSGITWRRENLSTYRRACPSPSLSTKNPMWTCLESNQDLCGNRPMTTA